MATNQRYIVMVRHHLWRVGAMEGGNWLKEIQSGTYRATRSVSSRLFSFFPRRLVRLLPPSRPIGCWFVVSVGVIVVQERLYSIAWVYEVCDVSKSKKANHPPVDRARSPTRMMLMHLDLWGKHGVPSAFRNVFRR
ncbi:unnamed protein product [Ectocarpus sp. 12 AP-2014]